MSVIKAAAPDSHSIFVARQALPDMAKTASMSDSVIIVGGGIGGLAAAVSLFKVCSLLLLHNLHVK
jgi:heterodisulfide reductase subunit A-like polyferredoxin